MMDGEIDHINGNTFSKFLVKKINEKNGEVKRNGKESRY